MFLRGSVHLAMLMQPGPSKFPNCISKIQIIMIKGVTRLNIFCIKKHIISLSRKVVQLSLLIVRLSGPWHKKIHKEVQTGHFQQQKVRP